MYYTIFRGKKMRFIQKKYLTTNCSGFKLHADSILNDVRLLF